MKRIAFLALVLLGAIQAQQVFRVDPIPAMTTAGTSTTGGYPALYAIAGATIQITTDAAGTTPATTYANQAGSIQCPVGAPVVIPGTSVCTATTGAQGQFGFWLSSGTYYYKQIAPNGNSYGPYPITINTLGVTQITAGSGVTISPSGGTGDVTINATGSIPIVSSYNWGPISSASVLTGGNPFTLTLSPVPLGVNANNPSYSMSITGCSGGNQTVAITGGTAVSGATSGTVIFTPSVSCALGFAIGSASAGLQESICALPSAGGEVIINNTPTLLQNVNLCNKTDVAVFKEAGSTVTGSYTVLGSSISGLPGTLIVANNAITTDTGIVFTPLTGVLYGNGSSPVSVLPLPWTVGQGGTGDTTLTQNGVLLGNGTSAIQATGAGSTYQSLTVPSGGPPAAFGPIALNQSAAVSGALTRSNGGLNSTSPGTGILRDGSTPTASELSGDVTTSGSNAVTVVQIEGGAIPASALAVGTNSSKQLVVPTFQGTGDTKILLAGTVGAATTPLCADANGGATTSGCSPGFTLPSGTQTQYLQIQPNTGNSTTARFNSLPTVAAADYVFPAQTPGGSLVSGNNTVTLTPVPLGVNGTDTGHYLYVSAGSGAAESCLITGGTAVSGGTSGTVVINCSNVHNGAWTIQSATEGLKEAEEILKTGSSTGGGSIILAPGLFSQCGEFISDQDGIFVIGSGQGTQIQPCFANQTLFGVSGGHAYPTQQPRLSMSRISFTNNGLAGVTAIDPLSDTGGLYEDLVFNGTTNAFYGIYCDRCYEANISNVISSGTAQFFCGSSIDGGTWNYGACLISKFVYTGTGVNPVWVLQRSIGSIIADSNISDATTSVSGLAIVVKNDSQGNVIRHNLIEGMQYGVTTQSTTVGGTTASPGWTTISENQLDCAGGSGCASGTWYLLSLDSYENTIRGNTITSPTTSGVGIEMICTNTGANVCARITGNDFGLTQGNAVVINSPASGITITGNTFETESPDVNIYLAGSSGTISKLVIVGNLFTSTGNAFAVSGSITFNDSYFSGNYCTTDPLSLCNVGAH